MNKADHERKIDVLNKTILICGKKPMNPEIKRCKTHTTIRIAILTEEPLGWGSGKHYFPMILNKYHWNGQHKTYSIQTTAITDKDIVNGKLTLKNFDVLLVPGGGVGDGEAVVKGFSCMPKVKKWKKQILNFVKDGGGYIGICGGTALATELATASGKHETLIEKLYQKSAIDFTQIKSYYKDLALPIFCISQYKQPEKIGAMGYIFSFSPGETKDGKRIHSGGVPVDFVINKSHPIFSDVSNSVVRIRWWGGPGLILPEKPDRIIDVLASFPSVDISDDDNTRVFAWRYTGGLLGLIKGLLRSFQLIKREKDSLKNVFLYAFYLAGDWQKSNRKISMDLQNRPSITAETFPNENKARIILCTSHPEYMIWYDGHINEEPTKKNHTMGDGFHRWHDIRPLSKDLIEEFTATWWIVRRFVAWTAKVPDEDLPPIEKGVITPNAQIILSENIFWNETLLNQLKNI